MKSGKKNTKRYTLAAVLMLLSMLFTACTENDSFVGLNFEIDTTKYASDYDTGEKDYAYNVYDSWDVWKRTDTGVNILYVHNGNYDSTEPRDYVGFWVFDTDADAKAFYDKCYDESKEYDGGTYWEEGKNWFVSQEPGVYDAGIVWILYREKNVIITADLMCWSEWPEWDEENQTIKDPVDDETTTEEAFDTYSLKDYIILNAPELRKFVLETVLGYK